MTEYFYPSPARNNGAVSITEHQDLGKYWAATGVWSGLGVSISGSSLVMSSGEAHILGMRYVNTASVTVPVPTNAAQRIGRLVLRLDRDAGTITPTLLLSAGEPALRHTATEWDLPLIRTVVPANSAPSTVVGQAPTVPRPPVLVTPTTKPGMNGTPAPSLYQVIVNNGLPEYWNGASWVRWLDPLPTWSPFSSFHNGASDVGGSLAARHTRRPDGSVHLEGAIRIPSPNGIDNGLVVARVPVTYAPSPALIVRSVRGSNNELYRLQIRKDNPDTCSLINDSGRGLVAGGFIELGGVSWFPAQ